MTLLTFPSKEWCLAAAQALHVDPTVQAALAEFGPFTAGAVIERGDGLARDFCVLTRAAPGLPPKLDFLDDEDELEEHAPDYLAWIPHRLVRELLEQVMAGQTPDPLQLVLSGRVKVQGDMKRVVRVAPRHPTAGVAALRSVPTRLLK